MKQIPRIGKWAAKAALEAALESVGDDDSLIIVSIDSEDKVMRHWSANCTSMQVNWMADCIKMDLFIGEE